MNKTLPKALTAFNNSKITQPLHNTCVTVWLGIPLSKGQIIQVSTSFLSALQWVSQYWSFWAEVRVTRLLMIGLGSDERNSSSFLTKCNVDTDSPKASLWGEIRQINSYCMQTLQTQFRIVFCNVSYAFVNVLSLLGFAGVCW